MASLNISGEKMSKSLGNFFTVHELLDQHPAEAIRLLCSRRSTASRSTSRMRG